MKIPTVEKFFGCVELRQATIGIGWGYGILLLLSFISFLLALLGNNTNGSGSIATAIISLLSIFFCYLLVRGAQTERESFVRWGMYFLMFHAILLVIACFASLGSIGLVVFFIYVPLTIYCVITVYSYWLLMSNGGSAGGV